SIGWRRSRTGCGARERSWICGGRIEDTSSIRLSSISWRGGSGELSRRPGELHEERGGPGAGPPLLLLGEDVRLAPRLLADSITPALEIAVFVGHAPQSQVAPIRGRDERRIAGLSRIRDAPGSVPLAERVVDVVLEPGRMAELERGAGGKDGEE